MHHGRFRNGCSSHSTHLNNEIAAFEDRKDNGCLLDDREVLAQAKIWSVIREEQAHDQTIGEFTRGKWWMTYGLLGETGSVEFSCAES